MTIHRGKNEQLLAILQARCDEAQATYQSVCDRISKTNHVLQQLGNSAKDSNIEYQVLGADILWRNWVERRRTAIMYELSRLYAEREDTKQILRRENGRFKAFSAVLGKQEQTQRQLSERTADAKLNSLLTMQELARRT